MPSCAPASIRVSSRRPASACAGPAVAVGRELLDPRPARGEQGELGGDEEAVQREQHHRQHERGHVELDAGGFGADHDARRPSCRLEVVVRERRASVAVVVGLVVDHAELELLDREVLDGEHLDAHSFDDDVVADLGDAFQPVEHESGHRVVLAFRQVEAGDPFDLVGARRRVDQPDARLDLHVVAGVRRVVLVLDRTDEFLDDVLEGHHAGRRSVLVDDDGHLGRARPQLRRARSTARPPRARRAPRGAGRRPARRRRSPVARRAGPWRGRYPPACRRHRRPGTGNGSNPSACAGPRRSRRCRS